MRRSITLVPIVIACSLVLLALSNPAAGQCPCACPADVTGNTLRDGLDIDGFVRCVLGGPTVGPGCGCADLNTDSAVNLLDVSLFVNTILSPGPCGVSQGQYEPGPVETPPASPCSESRSCAGRPDTGSIKSVYLFNGEFYHSAVDLRIKGRGLDFVWARKYRSRYGPNTAQGNQWDFSYNIYIEQVGQHLLLHDGNSRQDLYLLQPNGKWARDEFFRELQLNGNGTYTLTFGDIGRWVFRPLDGSNRAGKIMNIFDRNGNVMDFTYNNITGRLQTITDSNLRPIQIAYNADGLISTVTDFTGRQVVYSYYQSGDAGGGARDLKSVRSPIVTGTPHGNDYPSGKTTEYSYTKGFLNDSLNHNLLTIKDPKLQIWLTNTYHPTTSVLDLNFDRLIRQVWGNPGDIIDVSYAAQAACGGNNFAVLKAIVNDRVGNVKEYYYDATNRLVRALEFTGRAVPNLPTTDSANRPTGKLRAADPDYYETRWTYNADAMPTLITYPNLNTTANTYELDLNPLAARRERGNLRSVTRNPGPLGGDQASITEGYTYETGFGGCGCGTNFVKTHTDGRGNTETHTYDAFGNRTHTDHRPGGGVEDWTYNSPFGQMLSHTLPANCQGSRRIDSYTYYNAGPQTGYLQSEVIDSGGFNLTSQYEYDAVGNVVRQVDPRGNDALYTYNSLDQELRRLSRIVSGVRYESLTWYDADDNVIRTDIENRDELGVLQANTHFSTIYEYEILNRPSKMCQEKGSANLTNSQLTCAAFPAGTAITTEYFYDANRNLSKVKMPQTQPGAAGGQQTTNTVDTEYDERDLVFKTIRAKTDPTQSTDQTDYDGNGNVTRTKQGLEDVPGVRITNHTHDGYNRRKTTTDPIGNVTTYTYDANSNQTRMQVTGDRGLGAGVGLLAETNMDYDPMDRQTSRRIKHFVVATGALIGDGESATVTAYANNSQVCSVTYDTPGHTTTTSYDTANRVLTVTDAKGNTVTRTYDANSNATQTVELDKSDLNPGPGDQTFTTTSAYDNLDRLTSTLDNVGNTRQLAYDSRSNRVLSTDARTNKTRYEYDGLSRLLTTSRDMDGNSVFTDAVDIVTQQTWDDDSRLKTQTDDNGNPTEYFYDALNRRDRTEYADCTFDTTTYDVHDNATQTTDENGSIVNFSYDLLNRVTNKTITPGAGVSNDTTFENYQHDGLSRPVRAEDNDSVVIRAYDSLSNVTTETQQITGGPVRTVTAIYDGESNQTRLTHPLPGLRAITRTYDVLDRPAIVNDDPPAGPPIATDAYIGPYRVEQRDYPKLNPAQTTRCTFLHNDGLRRITGMRHERDPFGAPTQIDIRQYDWDANSNKTHANRAFPVPVEDRFYTYDAVNRLIQSQVISGGPPCTTNYVLDGVGNRQQVTGCVDPGAYTMDPALCDPGDFQMNQYTTTPATVSLLNTEAPRSTFLTEPFAYPDGNLAGNGAWTAHSSPGLVPVQVNGGQAKLVQGSGSREDVNALLGTTMGAGQKYYAAFDLTNTGGNGNVYFAHFKDSGVSNFASRVFITNNGLGDYTVGLSGSSAAVGATWPTGLTFGTTYRIVTSYEFNTGNVELWVNPLNQGSTSITATGSASFAMSAYALRQANPSAGTSNQAIDNLCVGDSFAEAANCLAPPAATHRLYDDNGNLTDTFSVPKHYTYDYLSRLVQFFDSGTGQTTTYRYDCLGRRIEKNVGGAITRFYYDGHEEIEEQNAANATVATYVYSKGRHTRLQMVRGGQKYFYHEDDLGSVMKVTDGSGNLKEGYSYGDYGKPSFFDGLGNPIAASAIGNPWLFHGYFFDNESSFYLCASLYLATDIGEYVQRPLGGMRGNGFANARFFAANNPVSGLRLEPQDDTGGEQWEYDPTRNAWRLKTFRPGERPKPPPPGAPPNPYEPRVPQEPPNAPPKDPLITVRREGEKDCDGKSKTVLGKGEEVTFTIDTNTDDRFAVIFEWAKILANEGAIKRAKSNAKDDAQTQCDNWCKQWLCPDKQSCKGTVDDGNFEPRPPPPPGAQEFQPRRGLGSRDPTGPERKWGWAGTIEAWGDFKCTCACPKK